MYAITVEPDDNGTLLVTCPDLPEVTTFGDDKGDAMRRAAGAIEEAIAARIARDEDIPGPSRMVGQMTIGLPPLTSAKVELYRAARASGITKAELGRRLGWDAAQVDRLFDLRHRSQIEKIDRALHTIGKRLEISVQDMA